MGTKKEIKEQITSILEENLDFILNTQDSILNLEKTLSTNELRISMYHIKTFMKNKGYIHNKTTNEWYSVNNTEENPSNNEDINFKESSLKTNEPEIIKNKETLSETITDDLKEFLKKNSKERNNDKIIKTSLNPENKSEEIIEEIIAENINEKSLIPEENILNEIWKITDNTSSNCELILKSITSLLKLVNDISLLLSKKEDNQINNINDSNNIEISSGQLMDILDGETKRYELTLSVAFFEAIKQKFFLKHPNRTTMTQLKDSKILYKILIDYFVS